MQKIQAEIQEKEIELEEVQIRMKEAGEKATGLKTSFEKLRGMIILMCNCAVFS